MRHGGTYQQRHRARGQRPDLDLREHEHVERTHQHLHVRRVVCLVLQELAQHLQRGRGQYDGGTCHPRTALTLTASRSETSARLCSLSHASKTLKMLFLATLVSTAFGQWHAPQLDRHVKGGDGGTERVVAVDQLCKPRARTHQVTGTQREHLHKVRLCGGHVSEWTARQQWHVTYLCSAD